MTNRNLFKEAHKMTKEIKSQYQEVDYKFQFGLCLTYLRKKGDNEMVELKGSENQISWAKDIKGVMDIVFKHIFENVKNDGNKILSRHLENLHILKSKIDSETDSSKLIEILGKTFNKKDRVVLLDEEQYKNIMSSDKHYRHEKDYVKERFYTIKDVVKNLALFADRIEFNFQMEGAKFKAAFNRMEIKAFAE